MSFLEDIQQGWGQGDVAPDAPPSPQAPSLMDSIQRGWEPEAAPRIPGIGGNVVAIARWISENPQLLADMIMQGIGTGGGVALGTLTGPAAPVAAPTLGAAGNVAGKQLSRRMGQALNFPDASPPPDIASVETAIDAGLGAAGPAASALRQGGSALARGVTRRAGGLTRANIGEADELATAIVGQPRNNAFREIIRESVDPYAPVMSPVGKLATGTALAGGTLAGLGIEPGLITAGLSILAQSGRTAIANRLLKNDAFLDWATTAAKGLRSRTQVAGSLAAVLADKALSERDRDDLSELRDAIMSPSRPKADATLNGGRRSEGPSRRQQLAAQMERDKGGRFVGLIQDLMGQDE